LPNDRSSDRHRFGTAVHLLAVLLVAFLPAAGCDFDADPVAQRFERLAKSKGEILIGAAGSWEGAKPKKMWEGIQMAEDEINAAGGVLGRRVRVLKEDDGGSLTQGKLVAQRLADNPDVAAVIGHFYSFISVQTAATYEFSGILMISPATTDPKITQQGFTRVFRTNPNNLDIGRVLAEYCSEKGYGKIALCYVNNDYGRSLANAFEARTHELGLDMLDSVPYSYGTANEFKMIIKKWQNMEIDAILLAGSMPEAANLIVWARKLGLTQPIVAGTGLDSPDLVKAGAATEGTVFTSFFDIDLATGEQANRLVADYKQRFGGRPDTWVVQGYDALHLLADAMNRAGSIVPDKVADTLRSMQGWKGVAGKLSFDSQGNPAGPIVVIKEVRGGKIGIVPGGIRETVTSASQK
jgi:branched-chain amino acid transport system substrate-binding protein